MKTKKHKVMKTEIMTIKLISYSGIELGIIPYIPGYGDNIDIRGFDSITRDDIYHNHVVAIVHNFQEKTIYVHLGEKPKAKVGTTRSVVNHTTSNDGFVEGMIVGGLIF